MPSDQQNQDEAVLTEHLQDQFVAWFVGVMTVVYDRTSVQSAPD